LVANSIVTRTANHSAIEKNLWIADRKKKSIENEIPKDNAEDLPDPEISPENNPPEAPIVPATSKKKPRFDPAANHGRTAGKDYSGCPLIKIPHQDLQAGTACPTCREAAMTGKLCQEEPSVIVQLTGSPLITGTRYEVERLRCGLCKEYYVAELPGEVAKRGKYDERCRTNVTIARYYAGQPFHRTERLQALQGIPLADATQWDLVLQLYKIILPVYRALEGVAANATLIQYDDTGNRILEAYTSKDKKVHTTSFISKLGEHAIYLFFTSLYHAGENVEWLLTERTTDEPLTTMTDASSQNIPKYMDENLMARWILCFCLVHGRRKFHELQRFFGKECEFVLDVIGEVYRHEDHCKKHQLTALQRLHYHQQHSAPLMQSLRVWLNNQLLHRQVEQNSAMGQAIRYMLRHWNALTRFLQVAGAPIDNSLCEQAIKVAIRHRRNSLFYKTYQGARVGDCMMSLIHTAAKNKVNIFDYLNTLQRYADRVKAQPTQWLPWNYQATRTKIIEDTPLAA
jgi:hypothetical protein